MGPLMQADALWPWESMGGRTGNPSGKSKKSKGGKCCEQNAQLIDVERQLAEQKKKVVR